MTAVRSESLFRKRLRKFKRLKRGYYSFVLTVLFAVGLVFELQRRSVAVLRRIDRRTCPLL